MGAWGTGSFENDGAADFAWAIAEGGLPVIEKAFDRVLAAGQSYLEDAEEAIAAAEVVAKLSGRGPSPLDDRQEMEDPDEELTLGKWLVSSRDLRSSWICGATARILRSGSVRSMILQSASLPSLVGIRRIRRERECSLSDRPTVAAFILSKTSAEES